MILHTFNKVPALATGGPFIQADDHVLFIEDGVYALLADNLDLPTSNIYVLEADISARGLASRVNESVKLVNYQGFVQLCCDADSVSNWS